VRRVTSFVSLIRRVAQSLLRITVATIVCAVAGFLLLTAALRQPSLRPLPFRGNERARPATLQSHVRFLTTDVRPRDADHPDNLDRAAAYIAGHFRRSGARVSEQPFDARGKRYRNVIAEFGPAVNATAPLLIVGAHYDAFSSTGNLPGADDNASGTAALLELARLLGTSNVTRPIALVAFSTEEPPFFGSESMGSAVHADALRASGRAVEGMICLEMVGYFSGKQTWPSPLFAAMYPTHPRFIAVAGGWDDRHLARLVKRGIMGAGGIDVVSFSGARVTSDASDQRNYWAHDWPAVVVTDTAYLRNPNYHTVRDTAETLDYARMSRVVEGVFNAMVQ
jgi:peptidase M28-like protein